MAAVGGGETITGDSRQQRCGETIQHGGGMPSLKDPGETAVIPQGFVPTSPPYYPPTPGAMGGDPTGLPIDHYNTTTFLAAPQQHQAPGPLPPTFLPDGYYAQPHFYPTAVTHPPASLASLAPHVPLQAPPTPPFANASSKRGGLTSTTHAAFIPPRSSSIRHPSHPIDGPGHLSPGQSLYPQQLARQTHFPLRPNPIPQHRPPASVPQEQQHPSRPTAPLDPCESFQSDSTASLVSESRFSTAPTKLPPTQMQRMEKHQGKHAWAPVTAAKESTYADLAADNQMLQNQNSELKLELEKRDQEIAVLRGEVRELDLKVKELRQFPAGKISQIPMA